ncbi:MAG TPA: glycoside-pentoside-hexuronide (GPH):cation symporter [Bacilli bacterium]|nr:glycoside-pentoside-hexuronide (GPH):cation symporter [Bacilli bacterium]
MKEKRKLGFNLTETFKGDVVPKPTKWIYSLSGIGRDAAYTLISLFFLTYIQYTGVLDEAQYAVQFGVITAIIVIARIWDGVNDPMIGSIIENTHWKWGKYKPWIFLGAVTTSVALLILFLVRPVGWGFVAIFGVFYLLWEITFTFNDIAYWSMLPSLSSDEKQRNELTTMVTVFAAVGAFAVGGIVPLVTAGNAVFSYQMIAIVVTALFFVSQLILVLTCKERERDLEQEKKQPKVSVIEMFRLMKTNPQLMWVALIIFTYYLGSSLLNSFGLNYFYFSQNYTDGGSIMFLFTVVYAAGTIVSQAIYPLLAKRFKRAQLINYSFLALTIGYILFFFVGNIGPMTFLPLDILVLAPIGVLIFAGQGVFYLTIMIMITNTIEYNEWTTGERKESIVFAVRPLAAKFSSSLQQGIVYIFLLAGGVLGISNSIAELERQKALNLISEVDVKAGADALILAFQNSDFGPWGLTILKIGIVVIPLALFALAFVMIKKKYTIDEVKYSHMLEDIAAGRIGVDK